MAMTQRDPHRWESNDQSSAHRAPPASEAITQRDPHRWESNGQLSAFSASPANEAITQSDTGERPKLVHPRHVPVTLVLIGFNLAMYLVEIAYPPIVGQLGEIGERIAAGEYYRLLTSAFIHAPPPYFVHIASNMVALWVFGRRAEPALGAGRYLAVYLASALGGATVSYAFLAPQTNAIGASGAIFGVLGALLVLSRRSRPNLGSLGVILLLNMAFSFTVPYVDWYDHLGGLVAGALLAAAMALPRDATRRLVGATASLILAVAVFGTVTYRSSALQTQLRSFVGTYSVTGTLTTCTGFTPAGCASVANLRAQWTISNCTGRQCILSGLPWGTPVVLNLTDGQWIARAERDPRYSTRCRGTQVPTTDVLTLTSEVVDGVGTIHGTLRTSASPWGCRASMQTWAVTGSR